MRKLKLEELGRLSPEEYREREKLPVVLVLDSVRSGLNVGSIFRTADAFGLEKLVLCGITAQPPHREILKTAIGATETVAWSYEEEVVMALRTLKTKGYKILGVEQTDVSLPLQQVSWEPGASIALVLGNEVDGIQQAGLPMLDGAIEIPQFGTKHSLNVAVCAGIVVWDLVKAYRWGGMR